MDAERKVLFEPSGKLHPSYRYFLDFPPPGYRFVLADGAWEAFTARVARVDILYYNLWRVSHVLPITLIKARLDARLRSRPAGAGLTFAVNHVVYRPEPWVVLVEWVNMLTGFWMPEFRKHRREIEDAFSSPWCKRILTWCQPALQSILHNLDCSRFAEKIELLPLAVPSRRFLKTYDDSRVRLLFVGSAHAPRTRIGKWLALGEVYDFHVKGGKEVLEAFARLRPDYPKLELVVRASVPDEFKRRYGGLPGLTIIDELVDWPRLRREFERSDIYLFPCHQVTPWGSILDAMSFELPVILTDVFANPELVHDGRTGFLVRASEKIPYYDEREKFIPSMVTSRRRDLLDALMQVDERLVQDLVTKSRLLIGDPDLRRRVGKAARSEVEHGERSLQRRNARLQEIFDHAWG